MMTKEKRKECYLLKREAEQKYIKTMLEHAPVDSTMHSPGLVGWRTATGLCVCVSCAGRIFERGCRLPFGTVAVWTDTKEPFGVCSGCGKA
jgi:hypothetical protein